MYNKDQYNLNANGYQTEKKNDTQNYYRNDVPTGSGASPYGGNLEEMLFYNGSANPSQGGGSPSAFGAQAQAERSPSSSQTVYAEPEQVRETGYYSQAAKEEVFDEDAYPSVTTMQFKDREANPYEDYREENETYRSKRFKVTTKGKVLVAVYALVVMTILLLIVLNTRLLKNMNAQIESQQMRITTLKEETELLDKKLDYVRSDAVIEQKAASELGMIHD